MVAAQERRSGDERRAYVVYCRYGSERRENSERRAAPSADGGRQSSVGAELWRDYWGASEDDTRGE